MNDQSNDRPRVYADFNKPEVPAKDGPRLVLTTDGTFLDLARQSLIPEEGLEVTFYMNDGDDEGNNDELEIEGHMHFDRDRNYWVGIVPWDKLRHASERRCE